MMTFKITAIAAGFVALAALVPGAASAQALRFDAAVASASITTLGATEVQYRRHNRGQRHYGRNRSHRGPSIGAGIAGLAAGAIIGGVIANSQRPTYYETTPGTMDDAIAYCVQRFRSYDIGSGTYLGYDGVRHACP
jgi:hypothetical protein